MLRVQIRLRFGNICACISLIHTTTANSASSGQRVLIPSLYRLGFHSVNIKYLKREGGEISKSEYYCC